MNLLPGYAAYTCSKEMLAAVGALVEMQGIVRMMQQICSGVVFEQRDKVGNFEESGHWQSGHHLVDNFENVACSSLLEILPQISGEVTRDPTWW